MSVIDTDGDTPCLIAPEPMRFKEVLKLFLRTWPYLKPVVWHIVGWFSLAMLIGFVAGYISFTGVDLFNTKVLEGQPVQPARTLQQVISGIEVHYLHAA